MARSQIHQTAAALRRVSAYGERNVQRTFIPATHQDRRPRVTELWARPDSLVGQLQRGRGRGWLRAVARSFEGLSALRDCLAEDPCWDAQVEDRGSYYATLALELDVRAADVAAQIEPENDDRLAGIVEAS